MAKTKIAMLVLTLSSAVNAGTMGPVATGPEHALFVSGEGAYTWSSLDNVFINGNLLNTSYNGWGGRVAAGAVHHTVTPLSYTAEIGWGYYGDKDYSTPAVGVSKSKDTLYGVDLLVGADYRINQFDVFAKAGAMIESEQQHQILDTGSITPGGVVTGSSDIKNTHTNILPELKVGAGYNFNEELALTLAYMYAFGNNTTVLYTSSATVAGFNQTVAATTAPVSLSTLFLGLRYNFA